MDVSAPHYNYLKIYSRLELINSVIFWIIPCLTVFTSLFERYSLIGDHKDILHIISLIIICVYFVLEIIGEYIVLPKAEDVKMNDLVDNSFGSVFSQDQSKNYFDNDDLQHGIYKAAVNLFEKSFFTYSLIRSVTVKKILIPAIMLVVIILFSIIPFFSAQQLAKNEFIVLLMETLFSANILGSLIKHLVLRNRLSSIHESWIALFNNQDLKTNTVKYEAHIYKYCLQYEKLLSRMYPGISDVHYKKQREKLTQKWKTEIRKNYKI